MRIQWVVDTLYEGKANLACHSYKCECYINTVHFSFFLTRRQDKTKTLLYSALNEFVCVLLHKVTEC